MNPGEACVVEFEGEEHQGEIVSHRNGWVRARILIDPLGDYGSITPRLAPISEVCVRESHVRKADQ